MADPNTRQGKRTPVTLKIKFKSETLEQFIERYAVDVSQGGIFIRTKEPLAVGTQMRFEFQLRDASPLIGGEGTVVWTRENDPSRPAIAPGMGVRFDRLAEGSQNVLERILAEKAKQAPQRPISASKQPLFTDTPTKVAPAPIQDALLGSESKQHRMRNESYNDQHTPLPKPMPFHSDADEFPDEAFEEATKVRALDDLVAQTAHPAGTSGDMPMQDRGGTELDPAEPTPDDIPPSSTAVGVPRAPSVDRDSAPNLPSPPDLPSRASPRLLDTTPSPRETPGAVDPMEKLAKTRLGLDPVPATRGGNTSSPIAMSATMPATSMPSMQAPSDRSGRTSGPRASVPYEPTSPVFQDVAARKSSSAPMVLLGLVLLAAAAAGVWFFVLRDRVAETTKPLTGSASGGSGSALVAAGGSNRAGSGSSAVTPPPPADLVETKITANIDKAKVEVVGTTQTGDAPFQAKLEKGKPYKVRVSAPHYTLVELDVTGGQPEAPQAKLALKPRVITATSDPAGALIYVDGVSIGHTTPYEVELTKAQIPRKSVKVTLRKAGFRSVEKTVNIDQYVEDDAREVAKIDEKLVVAPIVSGGNRPPNGSGGSAAHPGSGGSGSSGTEGSGGSASTPPPNPGSGTAANPGSAGGGGGGGGGATGSGGASASKDEPEPDFMKK